jgi:hypothetical protein
LKRSPDSETNDEEAKQQTDTEDEEMSDREFENLGVAKQDLEDANEVLEARDTSADGLDEGSDEEIIYEIRVERLKGTPQDLKEITAILRFW